MPSEHEPEGFRNRVFNRNDLTLEDYYYLDRILKAPANPVPATRWVVLCGTCGGDPDESRHTKGAPFFHEFRPRPIEVPATPAKEKEEKIASAAVRKDGVVYPCWAHTYDEIKRMNLHAPDDVMKFCEQGFVTSTGRYVDRGEAFDIATAAGQIIHKHGSAEPRLYSEDLRPVVATPAEPVPQPAKCVKLGNCDPAWCVTHNQSMSKCEFASLDEA